MNINPLSAAIGGTNIANGDDPIAILQALQGLRYGAMLNALGSAVDFTSAELLRAQRMRELGDLASRLQAMPDAPGGQSKVLSTFSAGAQGLPAQQIPDATLAKDLQDQGLTLPTQQWFYAYDTAAVPGDASGAVLLSPEDIAKIKAACPLDKTVNGVDYYAQSTGSASEPTTYIAIYKNEGAYCAKDSDIATMTDELQGRIDDSATSLNEQLQRLSGLSGAFMADTRQDLPFTKFAREQQAHHDERHAEALLEQLQETPSASSNVRKGDAP